MESKAFSRVKIDDITRKSFREKREQRQAELKAKIAAQRLEREAAKSQDGVPPIRDNKKNEVLLPGLKKSQDFKKPEATKTLKPKPTPSATIPKKPIESKPTPRPPISKKSTEIKQTKASQLRLKKNNPLAGLDTEAIKKQLNAPKSAAPKATVRPSLRRSITSIHTRRLNPSLANQCVHKRLSKSRSEENITQSPSAHYPSPIPEEPFIARTTQRVAISTPVRKSVHFTVGQTPAPSELRDRLIKWLKKHGKSLNSYQHLRCFGVHQPTPYRPRKSRFEVTIDDEDKENREDLAEGTTSTESLPKVIDYTNMTTNEDLFGTPVSTMKIADMNKMAQDALCDVHSLILEKYPQDQCLEWLSALKKKFPQLQDHPQYWECCAALGEINGEFAEAVDCYKQAIIKGAQVTKIEHSLEKLMEAFSFLELDPKKRDSERNKKRSKTVLDAHNIFTSTIIKFAVYQREHKMKAPASMQPLTPLIAQPVRRSTRISMTNTPNNSRQLYKSINEIENSLDKPVIFGRNVYLYD